MANSNEPTNSDIMRAVKDFEARLAEVMETQSGIIARVAALEQSHKWIRETVLRVLEGLHSLAESFVVMSQRFAATESEMREMGRNVKTILAELAELPKGRPLSG